MSAETVAAGAFTPPANLAPWLAGDPSAYKRLPAFCRVLAVARPSADSEIKIEVWMPASGWNGRFRGQGNGGFAGEIDYGSLAAAVGDGYASAPANFWTHLLTSALWDAQATTQDEASYIPSSKLPAIARAVNAACDAQDGVADGILNDPRHCRFDPASMQCQTGDAPTCLTP